MSIQSLQRFGATVYHSTTLKSSRPKLDVLTDRIRQAAVEPTLMGFGQRLCDLMACSPSVLQHVAVLDFMHAASQDTAPSVLQWVRSNQTLFAVLCASKHGDADKVIEDLKIAAAGPAADDAAISRRPYHIGIRAECRTPLSHGSDLKSGNATLFRRMAVLGQKGTVMDLPYYAGNAIRGQVRDILADHFTAKLGLTPRRDLPPYQLWFFHALYAGGALEETNAATKLIAKELGDHGSVRSDGFRRFRDTLPALSLLGCSMGNRVLSGHADFGDLRPVCREWGNGGDLSVNELFEWVYLTRREDHEAHEEHSGMIATTEVIKAGTTLEGGIDIRLHTSDFSRSALGVGLRELAARGRIGAQNRADLGGVVIEYENAPDPGPYEAYLEENRKDILDYLRGIGAISGEVADVYGQLTL